ncbi:thiol:disulfide interchange protein DsbA/DsbL [Spongiibacter nanhainus]|uniref:Thiol:disulfide interchange protein n=1 Tax=Spongiibacter nanhainus TaxID=2794344 RepID=A0A7T4URL7_9GAMM|nr:thiol:disulfide interchange protein DsbA/DsbL [Spongiibacter nanhainus]QQD18500.1 thiol:disulfide interchange protein DsbA/DsbL [Spongiibacter nanhainus]
MKNLWAILAVAVLGLSLSACSDAAEPAAKPAKTASQQQSQPQPTPKAGEGYIVIQQPVRTANPDKIEVTEVFWYGCGHCFDFEPMVTQWAEQLPEDVEFRQSPAMWNELMVIHAQAYYTAKALGVLEQVHQVIFDEINLRKNPLRSRDALEELFLANSDLDAETFRKAFDSFGVKSQVKQADARARAYGIAGTPELIVNGKYRVTGRAAGSKANMLKVAEQLIAQERAAQ